MLSNFVIRTHVGPDVGLGGVDTKLLLDLRLFLGSSGRAKSSTRRNHTDDQRSKAISAATTAATAAIAAQVSGFTQAGYGRTLTVAAYVLCALVCSNELITQRRRLQLDVAQPVLEVWDPLSDRSMSCGVGARATSDRKPNW